MNVTLFTDLRYTTRLDATGVDKHVVQMARGLATAPGVSLALLTTSDQEQQAIPGVSIPTRVMPLTWRISSALWTLTGHPVADRWIGPTDWVYAPKNDWIPVRRARYAVTIHGAPELDPELPPPQTLQARIWTERNRLQYRRICARADLILTVSEFLKERIVTWFHCDPDRIVIIGNGVDPCFFAAAQPPNRPTVSPSDHLPSSPSNRPTVPPSDRPPLPPVRDVVPSQRDSRPPSPYILCVGGLNFLDGGDRIVALAKTIRQAGQDLRIRVAGSQHRPDLLRQAMESGRVDLLGYVLAEQLAQQMAGAVALYYPTRYETFGLAAAEAMAVGTPVVTCRSTAVPEIVGDAGLYVDPDRPDQAYDVVRSLNGSATACAELVARGWHAAASHTWQACVNRLIGALT